MKIYSTRIKGERLLVQVTDYRNLAEAQLFALRKFQRLGRDLFNFRGRLYIHEIKSLNSDDLRLIAQVREILGEREKVDLSLFTPEGRFAQLWEQSA